MTHDTNGMFPVPVAIVSFSQATSLEDTRSEPEMLLPVIGEAVDAVGLTSQDMGFVVSGSSDYLAGRPFSFVSALDAVGPWPPLTESHVEMDAAWALYEAVLRLQHGDIDTALIYGFGICSMSDVARTAALQLDPYTSAQLFPDLNGLNGLQARLALESGVTTQDEVAEIVARSLRDARSNRHAVRSMAIDAAGVLAKVPTMDPLRELDVPPVTDGCAAMVLTTLQRARELVDNPVQITGMDHRIEAHALGLRDLASSPSATLAGQHAGATGEFELAELHTMVAHQEPILRRALGLSASVRINPSGGALAANPFMTTGLIRIGEAAQRLQAGEGRRALAHAQSGPCMQQNLVAVLEVAS
jgi:acetyl-CoA acetyltransferase